MKKFEFRLRRVLDYRGLVAEWAKEAYVEARVSRLRAEKDKQRIRERRSTLLFSPGESLMDRLALEVALDRLDQMERHQETVIEDLTHDEHERLREWLQKRQEMEALDKLREQDFRSWMFHANRAEQKTIDEWASQRKAA